MHFKPWLHDFCCLHMVALKAARMSSLSQFLFSPKCWHARRVKCEHCQFDGPTAMPEIGPLASLLHMIRIRRPAVPTASRGVRCDGYAEKTRFKKGRRKASDSASFAPKCGYSSPYEFKVNNRLPPSKGRFVVQDPDKQEHISEPNHHLQVWLWNL